MSGLNSNIIGLTLAASVAGAQAEEPNVAPTGNEQVAVTTQAATQRLMVAMDTTLVAQAAPAESDGKPPKTVMVKQVDGSLKPISYFRDKQGSIIPPEIVDGKLVDGSPAPSHPIRALNAQVKILVPYDKNAQIARAMVGDRDLITDATTFSTSFIQKIDKGQSITRGDLETFLFHYFILAESGIKKTNEQLKFADYIGTNLLKLTSTELSKMKTDAEQKAKKLWKETTGAMA